MTTSKLFVAAIAMSAALATPAFARWQSQEPAAHPAQYPNGNRNVASPAKSPRPTVIRATKGN